MNTAAHDDPVCAVSSSPIRERVRVAVVGAGAGGLAMAVKLKRAGINDFVILERSDGVGGVWRQNRYPGAACDVMSHFYSFSFAPKPDWSRRFGTQKEIIGYFESVADQFGLRPHLHCGVEVVAARWDDSTNTWTLSTADGQTVVADVFVSALGIFSEPKDPPFDVSGFDGTIFHSSRWRHDVDLTGQHVAVIGTGPTAIQFVPQIAPIVEKLHVFQREPGWVIPKIDPPYTEKEMSRFRRWPVLMKIHRARIYLKMERAFLVRAKGTKQDTKRAIAQAHLERQVGDPQLREKLQPNYPIGCKRTLLTSDWYPTLSQPNVEVVTARASAAKGSTLIAEDGTERTVDTIIFAHGFRATDYLATIDVVGSGGARLRDAWANGARAYLGTMVPRFPNLFIIYGPNTNALTSLIFILERQAEFIVRAIRAMRQRNAGAIEPTHRATDRYARQIAKHLDGTVWLGGCTTYFRDEQGHVSTQYPLRAYRFWLSMRRIRRIDFNWRPLKTGRPSATLVNAPSPQENAEELS